MKILLISSVPRSLVNFRGSLLKSMVSAGHSVAACANSHDYMSDQELKKMGVTYHPIHLARTGMNPITDMRTLIDIIRMISQIKPDIILSYTIKPVTYGGIAARLCGVPSFYSLITGVGYAFMESRSLIQWFLGIVARMLYWFGLKKNQKVFFQNPDDLDLFLKKGLINPDQAVLINGSGVDLDQFYNSPLPKEPSFLMIARLLKDKGVREYVKAAKKIKKQLPKTRFLLIGNLDPTQRAIREKELRQWKEAGIIEYLGHVDDVRPAIKRCRFYVLPSYREGMPRTVLEAMSMGRPIITTDVPGCRETVALSEEGKRQKDLGSKVLKGENGFLVSVKDVKALMNAMQILLDDSSLAEKMAKKSREIAEEKFDVNKVNAVIMKEMGLTK